MKKAKNRVYKIEMPPSSGMFLSGIGGYPPPPFGGNLPAQKPFGNGGVPPPNSTKENFTKKQVF